MVLASQKQKEEVENYLHQKIEKGETVSPILPGGIKNYLIDIDGTICDDVPNEVKQERVDRIMQLQQEISLVLNREKIGKEFKVLIDEEEDDFYIGRTEYDSPEVDNSVLIPNKGNLRVGEFCTIRITDAQEFDLFGEIV